MWLPRAFQGSNVCGAVRREGATIEARDGHHDHECHAARCRSGSVAAAFRPLSLRIGDAAPPQTGRGGAFERPAASSQNSAPSGALCSHSWAFCASPSHSSRVSAHLASSQRRASAVAKARRQMLLRGAACDRPPEVAQDFLQPPHHVVELALQLPSSDADGLGKLPRQVPRAVGALERRPRGRPAADPARPSARARAGTSGAITSTWKACFGAIHRSPRSRTWPSERRSPSPAGPTLRPTRSRASRC